MRRELMEEIALETGELKEAPVALINDDSTEVGYVHFGVVHVLRVSSEDVAGQDSGIVAPRILFPLPKRRRTRPPTNPGARFCLDHLDSLLSTAAALGVTVAERVMN